MKPARFTLLRPRSIDEALDMLAGNDGAKLLAGGQSLVPLMNFRMIYIDHLVDLNALPELDYIRLEGDSVSVGALTRQRALERSEVVCDRLPLVAAALAHVGHWQTRNRGTAAGSIAHADPTGELGLVWLALDGELRARGRAGERTIRASSFFRTYFTTALEPDEIVTEVRFGVERAGTGWSFREVARRHGDFALVAVAVRLQVVAGLIADARVVFGGVANRPLRAEGVEAAITGTTGDADAIAGAVSALAEEIGPTGDLHASAAYRRQVAGTLASRALAEAVGRALS